jgi:hypothetical protein
MTYSTEAFVILRDGGLTHRRRINGEPSTLDQFPNFFHDAMTNGTRIHKNDHLCPSLLHKFLNLAKNKVLCM